MFNNFTFPNNDILTLNRIQFQFCIAEPTLNRGQNIIKHALTEGRTEYKIKNGIICVEMVVCELKIRVKRVQKSFFLVR